MTMEPVTIATVTHAGSFVDIRDFVTQLIPAVKNYRSTCDLIIINNSGDVAAEQTNSHLDRLGADSFNSIRVYGSPENNIGLARNIAIQKSNYDLILFLDDDEFPVPDWIELFVETLQEYEADMVAGPTFPLYLFNTPFWVTTVDLHNALGKRTGQVLEKAGAGNLLIRISKISGSRFSKKYGKSGGEDTEFLQRQVNNGSKLVWCDEGAAYEYIPKHKSSASYLIRRFVVQGQLHRKVMIETGAIKNRYVFFMKSALLIVLSLVVAPVLLMTSSSHAGRWVRRGFANLGHLSDFSSRLYPTNNTEEI